MIATRTLLVAAAFSGMVGAGSTAAHAQGMVTATIQVTRVKMAGMVTIGLRIGNRETRVPIDVVANDTNATVAAKIAAAFRADGATASGNTVSVPLPNGQNGGFGAVQNPIIDGRLDLETPFPAPPPPRQGMGMLDILPNPETGLASLATDTTVTAGFVGGLGLVSFTASAGTTDAALVAELNGALDAAGYSTSLAGPDAIILYGQGAGPSPEIDFALDPQGSVPAGGGLAFGLETIPEPGGVGLLAAALAALGAARRRSWA